MSSNILNKNKTKNQIPNSSSQNLLTQGSKSKKLNTQSSNTSKLKQGNNRSFSSQRNDTKTSYEKTKKGNKNKEANLIKELPLENDIILRLDEPSLEKAIKNNNIFNKNDIEKLNGSFKGQDQSNITPIRDYSIEIKTTPNINALNKIVNNSQDIINEQRKVLENISDLNRKLAASEMEVQRHMNKNENDDFNNFSTKYLDNLQYVIEKLKVHSEEMDKMRCN